ncbi:MAG: winged helix-turn-helix transcriptional regulator [Acidobacteria bacterium]|nr:winged helix-turn-helix transcriptional regulator [Acidobacteriota bacterium]MBI3487739.1 winged helix-turn-helix transcriptional regulator [Acidobacteriota bacterium]
MDSRRSPTLGTLLRHLIDLLDEAVGQTYERSGLDYRPRYTPVVRALLDLGPASIRTIAKHASLTHSAASQTISQMSRDGLVRLRPGNDARERIVLLAPKAQDMLPALGRHWEATNAAAQHLEQELSASLSALLREAIRALETQPFLDRIDQRIAKSKPSPPMR